MDNNYTRNRSYCCNALDTVDYYYEDKIKTDPIAHAAYTQAKLAMYALEARMKELSYKAKIDK